MSYEYIAQEARFRKRVVKYFLALSYSSFNSKCVGNRCIIGYQGMTESGRSWWSEAIDRIIIQVNTLRKSGCKRKYGSMIRVIKKWGQPDVKFVPSECIVNGKKYCQYTAVDECTRYCSRELYDEHSTYSSEDFIRKLIKAFPFSIRE